MQDLLPEAWRPEIFDQLELMIVVAYPDAHAFAFRKRLRLGDRGFTSRKDNLIGSGRHVEDIDRVGIATFNANDDIAGLRLGTIGHLSTLDLVITLGCRA